MGSLDHRGLRQFLTVADCGTLRAAARRLHISQPPLTAAIRQLEDRLGVTLFERSVQGMHLTEAGEVLAEEARVILGHLDRAESRLRALAGRPRPLRIGFVSAALNGAVPSLLRGLKEQRQPTPQLREMTTPEQLAALASGEIDVGLLHPPVPRLPGLESVPLSRDPFWAALPGDHRLAGRKALRFADIAGEPFVLFPQAQGPVLHEKIAALVRAASHRLTIAAEAQRVHSQLALIAGGLGIGLITRSTAQRLSFAEVIMIPLKDTAEQLFVELHLVAAARLTGGLSRLARTNRHQP